MAADAQFWDGIAEEYAAKPVDDNEAYQRKLALTKARLAPEHRVLDIGCGTGSLALELAPHVTHVHAVDVSGEMVKIANQKAARQDVSNVTFHQTAFDIPPPFEPESFDVICAYSILHLVEDRGATLQKIFERLAPGGSFISSTVCLGASYVPYGIILPIMRWMGKAPAVYILDENTLTREVRDQGFVNVSCPDVGAKKIVTFMVATKPG